MNSEYPGAESMASVLQSMEKYLPGVINVISDLQPKVAQTQASVDAAVSPQYAATQRQLYDTEGRRINQIGSEIETANQLAASQREADIAKTYGPELVSAADRLGRMLDPEFYSGRAAIGKGITDLLGSMDPTKLSGSERAEVERAVNRSGTVNPASTSQAVANAMTFGSALQDKQSKFADAVAAAAASLPATRTGVSAFEIGTRRALTPNSGDVKFVGGQTGAGQNAWNTGNQFMGQASNLAAIKNQKTKSGFDQIMEAGNMLGSTFSFM